MAACKEQSLSRTLNSLLAQTKLFTLQWMGEDPTEVGQLRIPGSLQLAPKLSASSSRRLPLKGFTILQYLSKISFAFLILLSNFLGGSWWKGLLPCCFPNSPTSLGLSSCLTPFAFSGALLPTV